MDKNLKSSDSRSADGDKKSILVIDDNWIALDFMVTVLVDHGYKMSTALDALEGMEKIKNNTYDLIIIDRKLPGMSGAEFYAKAVRIVPDIKEKVMFTSGEMDDEIRGIAEETGCQFLAKPFSTVDLLNAIREMLSGKKQKDNED